MISIQFEDFSVANEIEALEKDNNDDGALVTFTGRVRNKNLGDNVSQLHLEHYPGMTEKMLAEIIEQAQNRWQINRIRVIHRVGTMSLGDNIVFVGVTSPHRGDAYQASEFIMDFLKVKAPFWKKELTDEGERWLDARSSDHQKSDSW